MVILPLNEQEERIIEDIRSLKWGRVLVVVQNGHVGRWESTKSNLGDTEDKVNET
jgi:hypothetical protein